MSRAALCEASPSLALLKYWGKLDTRRNLPATPSIGVSLAGLTTRSTVLATDDAADRVLVDGREQPAERYLPFFEAVRRRLRTRASFSAESTNNFPTAAGLASSSSAFAALAHACARAIGTPLDAADLSALARVGSASAARAVFGGFTILPAGARAARQLYDERHWPELRILVTVVTGEPKERSSRDAMETARLSSPFYREWVRSARRCLPEALAALAVRDLEQLGEAVRRSYLRMFATMFSSDPPLVYWLPESVMIIHECERMRRNGIGVWETMDAGPQVKLFCLDREVGAVRDRLSALLPELTIIESSAGPSPECTTLEGDEWHA